MRFISSWILYWLGHAVSRIDWGPFYTPYNWLMTKSAAIQGNGPGPWTDVIPADER